MNMFDDDSHLGEAIQSIKECITGGFDTAEKYATTFQKYQKFYIENETLDLEEVKRIEHGKLIYGYYVEVFI